MRNASFEILYKSLVYEMHHKFGSHLATIEGLVNKNIAPDHEDYEHFRKTIDRLKADKKEMSDRYYLLEDYITQKNGGN